MNKQLEQAVYDATMESVISILCHLIKTTGAAIGDQEPVVKSLQKCLQEVIPQRRDEVKAMMDSRILERIQRQK